MSRVSLLSDLLDSIGARSWFLGDNANRTIGVGQLAALCHELVSSRGEASGVRLAAEILRGFRGLSDADAERFFQMLADEFTPDQAALTDAAAAFLDTPDAETLARLQHHAEAPRQELFRRLNLAPGGTAELVTLRERLLPLLKADRKRYSPVDADLCHQLKAQRFRFERTSCHNSISRCTGSECIMFI